MRVFSFKASSVDNSQDVVLDELVAIQKGNKALRSQFIDRYTNYIISIAGRVKGSYIQIENDEEYPIALSAFNKAIDLYDPDKGASFFTFAGLLIKRDVIDLYRRNSTVKEIPMSQLYNEEDNPDLELGKVDDVIRLQEDQFNLQQEIAIYRTLLKEYAIDFNALATISPSHDRVRRRIIILAKRLSEDSSTKASIIKKKTLPLKEIVSWVDFSRKTLERHRKYILANFILINSDLDYLKDYIKDVLEGGEDA